MSSDPPPNKQDSIKAWIERFGEAPETQMDGAFSQQCRDYDGDDDVRFLRDLRDRLVYAGGCSDFVIASISAVLSGYPESAVDMAKRRAELEATHDR